MVLGASKESAIRVVAHGFGRQRIDAWSKSRRDKYLVSSHMPRYSLDFSTEVACFRRRLRSGRSIGVRKIRQSDSENQDAKNWLIRVERIQSWANAYERMITNSQGRERQRGLAGRVAAGPGRFQGFQATQLANPFAFPLLGICICSPERSRIRLEYALLG